MSTDYNLYLLLQDKQSHLVVRRHIQRHQPLQERFRRLMVTEQCVSVHIISAQRGIKEENGKIHHQVCFRLNYELRA